MLEATIRVNNPNITSQAYVLRIILNNTLAFKKLPAEEITSKNAETETIAHTNKIISAVSETSLGIKHPIASNNAKAIIMPLKI